MTETVTWKGRLGPMDLKLGAETFAPSTISHLVADSLEVEPGDTVIDVGTGTGILAIVAAKLGAGRVFGTDMSADTIAVGRSNAEAHGVADRITFLEGDLFSPIPDDIVADIVIGDVSGIPDTLADESGWFPTKRGGGPRGSELPIRMLQDAVKLLRPGGKLFLPTGTLQDEAAILEVARTLYTRLRQVAERLIPLPGMLAESTGIKDLIDAGVVKLTPRGSRYLWEARVWELSQES